MKLSHIANITSGLIQIMALPKWSETKDLMRKHQAEYIRMPLFIFPERARERAEIYEILIAYWMIPPLLPSKFESDDRPGKESRLK